MRVRLAYTMDLAALISAWRDTLAGVPEVRRVDFQASGEGMLATGDTRTFRAVLVGPGGAAIPVNVFPPSLSPRLTDVVDIRNNADVLLPADVAMTIVVKCRWPKLTEVTGHVTFASSGTAAAEYQGVQSFLPSAPGPEIPFSIMQPQGPPTPRRGVRVSAPCYTFIESLEDPDAWLPEGNINQGRHGNTHKFHVWWSTDPNTNCTDTPDPNAQARFITVKIEKNSRWPGVAGNWGSTSDDDVQFEAVVAGPRWHLTRGGDHTSVTTNTPIPERQCVTVEASCFDFAAWADLSATAEDCKESRIVHIPQDTDTDFLPDAIEVRWKSFGFNKKSDQDYVRKGVAEYRTDIDDRPASTGDDPGLIGDGLIAWEEYRGFFVNLMHVRTSPLSKDLFVLSQVRLSGPNAARAGVGYLTNFPDLAIQEIVASEMDVDRRINFNNHVVGVTRQRALHVVSGDCSSLLSGYKDVVRDPTVQNNPPVVGTWGCAHVGVVQTGSDGICQTTRVGDDDQVIPVGDGKPNSVAIILQPSPGGGSNAQAYVDDIGALNLTDVQKDIVGDGVVTTGRDGVRQAPSVHSPDLERLGLGKGEPRQVCIEAGPNGEPNTTASPDDEPMFADGDKVGGVLGTPNEVYLLEVFVGDKDTRGSISEVVGRFTGLDERNAELKRKRDAMIRAVIAHECGHGIRIQHHSPNVGYTIMTDTLFVTADPPTTWSPDETHQNRLHLKSDGPR